MLRWFEHSRVYYPDRELIATGKELGLPFEDLRFKASDGVQLHGWFFPSLRESPQRRFAMLVCHGNAGNIGSRLGLARALLQTGINILLFDYRGFGQSEGRPTEEGTYQDAQAAYRWLQGKGFAGSNILAFGESLGGGVASELALREPLGGLVLQGTFTSIPDIGAELYPWLPVKWLSTIKYDTYTRLPRLPILVMHSRSDGLIRFHHAEKNFSRANEPKLMWELRGDHNESVLDPEQFTAGLEKFLQIVEKHNSPERVSRKSG
jgi:fermentation-respiration switch protein FrsA (DUF1100 family)